jgi:hypothetical protein
VLDESIREDFEAIEKLNRGDFVVVSRGRADERWLVASTVDDGGASYYSYDRRKKEGVHLFDARPDLAGRSLCSVKHMFANRKSRAVFSRLATRSS